MVRVKLLNFFHKLYITIYLSRIAKANSSSQHENEVEDQPMSADRKYEKKYTCSDDAKRKQT